MSIRCLHPSGRVRRKPFWLWVITFWVLGGIVTAVFSDTIKEVSSGSADSQVNGGFSFLICYALLYIANFFIHIQRLHDAGHSGWWMLFFFLFMMLFTVIIGLLPSEHQDNHYGPDTDANGRYLG